MATFAELYNAIPGPTGYQPLAPSPASSPMDFGGLLFGGMDGGLSEYLTDAQRQAMQRQAMLSAAAALLKSSGRSTTPVSLGQALGQGLEAGAAGYQQAQQGALAQLMSKVKLDEAKREQALQQYIMSRIPGAATGATPTASLLSPDQPVTGMQAAALPVSQFGLGPTPQRAAIIGQTVPQDMAAQELPGVTTTAKARPDIFSTLTPDQLVLAAMNPKTMLPKVFEESLKTESFATLSPSEAKALGLDPAGKYQQNLRTGQVSTLQAAKDEFKVVTGIEAESFGLNPAGKYQQNLRTGQISTLQAPKEEFKVVTGLEAETFGLPGSSKWQVNTTSRQATLVPPEAGAFGGGVQGNAYDIILNGVNSGKTDTVQYALAYRALSMPVPTEQVQADGSVKVVYTQPAPLPASIPKPTFSGKIPKATKPVTVVPSSSQTAPAPAPVTAKAPAPTTAPVVSAAGGTATQLPAGVKSTPYAPTPAQIGEARKQILTANKLVSAIDVLEADVRQNGMQIGGMGEAGGRQEAFFQDAILQLKELQNLGVLNGPDERILLQQLADPTSLKSYIKGKGGPEYVLSKIAELRNKANREVDLINSQFQQPITTPRATPSPTPMAPPPPVINEILLKYPAPRKP